MGLRPVKRTLGCLRGLLQGSAEDCRSRKIGYRFLLRTENVAVADPSTSPASIRRGDDALTLSSNHSAAFTALAALRSIMAVPRSRLRHEVAGGKKGRKSQNECQDRFHKALLRSASCDPSVTALFQGFPTRPHSRMKQRIHQCLLPHIRVSRVFGYAPGQDVHSVERVTILYRKPLKESGSEHLPDIQHSKKPVSKLGTRRFEIVALLKFAFEALAPRLQVF
jgi:hypothetical protein